jgi:hypothetical protein
MAIGSLVNPNYPVPGIDQSSKGFRDNFSAIKVEIENLQSKNIVLVGDASGNAIIDGGTGDVVINTVVAVANAAAGGVNYSVQYNALGVVSGDTALQYDYDTQTLIIDVTMPDTNYALDTNATKIHNFLAIQGDFNEAVLNITGVDAGYPTVSLSSTNNSSVGQANLNIANADSITADTLNIQFNGINAAQFNLNGLAVGAVSQAAAGGPSGYLEVYADGQADIGNFYSIYPNSDNGVRLETADANSTVGVVLQQTASDWVAGMRIGQTGNLTLHTGLNNDANLDDSSIVVLVDKSGRMGIGITEPQSRLDVDGGIQWNLPNTANAAPVSVGVIGVAIDSWSLLDYRSADYTVQVINSVGDVEITKLLVMHQDGDDYQLIYANLNSTNTNPMGPPTLGTILAANDGSMMQLIYSGNAAGNTVKVDATYITL